MDAEYPTQVIQTPIGTVRATLTAPDRVHFRIPEDAPITINGIRYFGDAHGRAGAHGHSPQIEYSYIRRVGGSFDSRPTAKAWSNIYDALTRATATLTSDVDNVRTVRLALLDKGRAARQERIAAAQAEIAALEAEIIAIDDEIKQRATAPYRAAYSIRGKWNHPAEVATFRAADDTEARRIAHQRAPKDTERVSVYRLLAEGVEATPRPDDSCIESSYL